MTVHADIKAVTREESAGISFLRRAGRSGTPLVLLHGIGSNAASFMPFIAALPPQIDVLAWDAPGYLQSGPLSAAKPTPEDYAKAAKQWLASLGVNGCVLLGHSLGALFATRFAAAFPNSVKALILLSPALGYQVASGAALPDSVQSRIDEIQSLGPAAFAAKRAARLVGDKNPQTIAAVEKAMSAVNPAGYTQAVHALGAGHLVGDAAKVNAPVMIAVGARDVITPPDNARTAQAAFPNATLDVVPDAGHALPQEQPDVVAKLVVNFVGRHADV
jgi:pimeloyl-ACP methyl ester carboxylesterase